MAELRYLKECICLDNLATVEMSQYLNATTDT